MFGKILNAIVLEELNDFLLRKGAQNSSPIVQLGKPIGSQDHPKKDQEEAVVCSLINIEQQAQLKNITPHQKLMKNPPINLNLYILFAADFSNYRNGLDHLAELIDFFHNKPLFTKANTPGLPESVERIAVEMINLDIHKLSNFWTAIGSPVVPSVVYKMRTIVLSDDSIIGELPNYTGIIQMDD